jgi:flagellar protein FliO/FliZ
MLRASLRRGAIAGAGVALVAGLLGPVAGLGRQAARADEAPISLPPRVAIAEPASGSPRPFPPRGPSGRRAEGRTEGAGGWWLGTTGMALALAVCGGIGVAARRGWPRLQAGGVLRVVGRTSLSPRHTVHLLSVGDRVLIVGTGPQGAPSLLGELSDPDDLAQLLPRGVMPPADASGSDRVVAVPRRRPAEESR